MRALHALSGFRSQAGMLAYFFPSGTSCGTETCLFKLMLKSVGDEERSKWGDDPGFSLYINISLMNKFI
jgi:hypothetical protein